MKAFDQAKSVSNGMDLRDMASLTAISDDDLEAAAGLEWAIATSHPCSTRGVPSCTSEPDPDSTDSDPVAPDGPTEPPQPADPESL